MSHALKIFIFAALVTAFYNYVGQMVPQTEIYPPEEIKIEGDLTTEQLVALGKEITAGKGTCLGCHTVGSSAKGRFPDWAGIGANASKRKKGYSDVDYLSESLYEPDAFIVEGFNPGMTPAHKPPIGLSDQEILAVIAYLQSLGGTPNVSMKTKLKYQTAPAP